MYNYAHRVRRTAFEVFTDFHSAKDFPLEYLIDVLPEIKPRSYSIASSRDVCGSHTIQLLVAIVKYKNSLSVPRTGVCTSWIASLNAGDTLEYSIGSGTFRLPSDPTTPVIMIGPGTGIAPMRSFLSSRMSEPKFVGSEKNILFFGCRNRQADFFYEQEFSRYHDEGKCTLITAFSRDGPGKVYVQHKIKERADLVWRIVGKEKGFVLLSGYICAINLRRSSKSMPEDVADALVAVFCRHGAMSEDDSRAYLKSMTKSGRFQTETW